MDFAKKLEELGRAFESFKETNDKSIQEIKAKGDASSETKTKLEKVETHLQSVESKLQEMNAALTRAGQEGNPGEKEDKKMAEYKKALNQYMRKGAELTGEMEAFARKALSVDSETGGGFFVEPETSSEIVKKIHESNPIRQLASVITISSASLKLNCDLDRPSASPVGERQSRTTTTSPTVRQVEIVAHEYYCFPEATQAFLDDAAVNVESWLSDYAGEAFALAEATDAITGTGVGRIRGITSYTDGTDFGYVERIQSDATGSITGDDLIDVQDALKEGYQRNAVWLMNRLFKSTVRKLKDGTQYLWQPGLQAGAPDTLLGRTVHMCPDLNTSLAATTDNLLIYGDIKAGYQFVDRVGIRVLRDPLTNKPFVGFYTTKRSGGGVKNFEALKIFKIKA